MSIEAGNLLRETREEKGVSIKEASDTLHIRIPYLQALENGRAEIIPSAVQARGFLRIYAEYLNLNAADVIQEWDHPGSTSLSKRETPAAAPAAPVPPVPVVIQAVPVSPPPVQPAPSYEVPPVSPGIYPPVSQAGMEMPITQPDAAAIISQAMSKQEIPERSPEQSGKAEKVKEPKKKKEMLLLKRHSLC